MPHTPVPGRCVIDLSLSGRPRVLEVVGGWEKTENKNGGGGGAQPSESVPVEKKFRS